MSLFELSAAVAGVVSGKHSSSNTAAVAALGSNEAALQEHLQQMCAAVRSCRHITASNSNAADPALAVQEALQITRQQLQRLLQEQQINLEPAPARQQGPQQPCHSQDKHQQQQQQTTSSSCALHVLQDLLQLAVGHVTMRCCCKVLSQPGSPVCTATASAAVQLDCAADSASLNWHAQALHRSARQQQLWEGTALEALQLFSLQELLDSGDLTTLQQALILQPRLLPQLLEELAAAVLPPLPPGACSEARQHSSTRNAFNCCASRSKCCSVMAALAESRLPWDSLPEVFVAHPPLMLKASSTLLSWLEATGHPRLWQLASLIIRPAWQHVVAAAPAAAAAATAALAARSMQPLHEQSAHGTPHQQETSNKPGSSTFHCSVCNCTVQKVLAGAFQLLCPAAWQQQLLQQLVQEPSAAGLAKLLQLLPGLYQDSSSDGSAVHLDVGEAHGASEMNIPMADAQCWPIFEEWNSSWQQLNRQRHHTQQQQQQLQQQQLQQQRSFNPAGDKMLMTADHHCQDVQEDTEMLKVLAAWRLVVQHRCWYEFACYTLVQRSITLQQQQQQQQEGQQLSKMAKQADESLRLAWCACAFIAWVHFPLDPLRQAQVVQQLMTPVSRSASSTAQPTLSAKLAQAPSTDLLELCRRLLLTWRLALSGNCDCNLHAAAAAIPLVEEAAGGVKMELDIAQGRGVDEHARLREDVDGLQCLVAVDLPVAVLQQLQLLMQGNAEELLQLCFPSFMPPAQQQQQQALADDTTATAAACGSVAAAESTWQAEQQGRVVMEPSVLCTALDAVDAMSSAAAEFSGAVLACNMRLIEVCPQQQAGQQQQLLQQACEHWLPSQWAAEAGGSTVLGGLPKQRDVAADRLMCWMVAARQLVQSSTACANLLKSQW